MQKEILRKQWTFTSFPIVNDEGKLLGLITRDEMDFVNIDDNPRLGDIMKTREHTITGKHSLICYYYSID